MKPWTGLVDLIEDNRHMAIKLRRWLSADDFRRMSTTPRILVDASNRCARDFASTIEPEERQELDTANYLIGQYEEALTFLGSMSIQ